MKAAVVERGEEPICLGCTQQGKATSCFCVLGTDLQITTPQGSQASLEISCVSVPWVGAPLPAAGFGVEEALPGKRLALAEHRSLQSSRDAP